MSKQNFKKKRQILKRLEKVLLSEHRNLVFQLLKKGLQKFIRTTNSLENLFEIERQGIIHFLTNQ